MSDWTSESLNLRPMRRLASKTVLAGFIATWFFAASPMSRSESLKATKEGVVRFPWSLGITAGEAGRGQTISTRVHLAPRVWMASALTLDTVVLPDTDARVRGSEIDTDCLGHDDGEMR